VADKIQSLARQLDQTARGGLWALPVWTLLLFLGTVTHQPDPWTDFAGFARYVTTTEFLISHIFASIIGDGDWCARPGGMAAFAQPAVGRLYLAGQVQEAVATYSDMYGPPLSATAAVGVLLLVIGVVALGIAIARSGVLPRWAGIGMAVGIVLFGIIGVILADFVQSIGAALLVVSMVWLAYRAKQAHSRLREAPRRKQPIALRASEALRSLAT
jgi:hypothetical protein